MDQETTVDKVLDELTDRTFISLEARALISEYLGMVYSIGYNSGVLKFDQKKKVIQFSIQGNLLRSFDSIDQAAKSCDIASCTITNVLKRRRKTAGGYKWKYKLD